MVAKGHLVLPTDLPGQVVAACPPRSVPGSLAEAEHVHVVAALEAAGWNITKAARVLDIDRVTLYSKIRKYEIQRPGPATED